MIDLFNIIRDFFVMYVFGGLTSDGDYHYGSIGEFVTQYPGEDNFTNIRGNTTDFMFELPFKLYDGEILTCTYVSMGDWLSTTATIITLVALFVGIALLTIKLFKIVSNLIALR